MRRSVPLLLALPVLALGVAACAAPAPDGGSAEDAADALSAERIRTHLRTLASDSFLGRGPGQPGGDLAAEYIADRFREAGLEPVDGSYYQAVPMIGTTPVPASVRLALRGPGGATAPAYLDDMVIHAGDPRGEPVSVEAELVFAGYGIDAPENGWADFGGVDVAGKVLLVLVNDPPAPTDEPELFGGPAMTYYGRWTYKYEEAARQGAAGVLIVHETEPAGYPWSVVRGGWSGEQFALPPDPAAPLPPAFVGWISRSATEAALATAGLDFEALKARAASRGFRAMPTGITASAGVESRVREVETVNVVGLLPGTARPDEVVTITSHYDHFGVGEVIEGDSIYNGAYDNASGTALLIEMAGATTAAGSTPERSLLFIATAAEEQGLLGAAWYAQSPLFPFSRTVAEVNVDGANLWGETDDVTVHGEERSDLGAFARARAAEMGLTIVPDAEPEKGFFFRSDHFPFALAGVPALYFEHGRGYRGRPEGWGDSIQADYTANHYHAPSDEYSEEFVLDGAVQQGRLALLTILDIANDDGWPNWVAGSEFKAARDRMMEGG
ncbi:MAG: M28 family peptidase [Longimicrobiales bacterium]|nr:M28 family peptidase [Longimicrobiales bacterium]